MVPSRRTRGCSAPPLCCQVRGPPRAALLALDSVTAPVVPLGCFPAGVCLPLPLSVFLSPSLPSLCFLSCTWASSEITSSLLLPLHPPPYRQQQHQQHHLKTVAATWRGGVGERGGVGVLPSIPQLSALGAFAAACISPLSSLLAFGPSRFLLLRLLRIRLYNSVRFGAPPPPPSSSLSAAAAARERCRRGEGGDAAWQRCRRAMRPRTPHTHTTQARVR